jgi:hypothetical protein
MIMYLRLIIRCQKHLCNPLKRTIKVFLIKVHKYLPQEIFRISKKTRIAISSQPQFFNKYCRGIKKNKLNKKKNNKTLKVLRIRHPLIIIVVVLTMWVSKHYPQNRFHLLLIYLRMIKVVFLLAVQKHFLKIWTKLNYKKLGWDYHHYK